MSNTFVVEQLESGQTKGKKLEGVNNQSVLRILPPLWSDYGRERAHKTSIHPVNIDKTIYCMSESGDHQSQWGSSSGNYKYLPNFKAIHWVVVEIFQSAIDTAANGMAATCDFILGTERKHAHCVLLIKDYRYSSSYLTLDKSAVVEVSAKLDSNQPTMSSSNPPG